MQTRGHQRTGTHVKFLAHASYQSSKVLGELHLRQVSPPGKFNFSFVPSPTDTRNTGADYKAFTTQLIWYNNRKFQLY